MRIALVSKTALVMGGLVLAAANAPAMAGEPHRLSPAELDSVTAGQIFLESAAFGSALGSGLLGSTSQVLLDTDATTNGQSASASASAFSSAFGRGNADAETEADTFVGGVPGDPTVRVFRMAPMTIRVGTAGDDFVGEVTGSFAVGFQFVPPTLTAPTL